MNHPFKTEFRKAYSIVRATYKEHAHLAAWDGVGWLLHRLTEDYYSDSSKLRLCRVLANAKRAYNARQYETHDYYTHREPGEIKIRSNTCPEVKHAFNLWRKARGLKPVKWKSEPCENDK